MRNLGKLLKQKTSTEFRWLGPGLGHAKEVIINGDHTEHHSALEPRTLLALAAGGQDSMRRFAEEQGYTGLEDVAFYIEPGIVTVSTSAHWSDDTEIEVEVFRLIAKAK